MEGCHTFISLPSGLKLPLESFDGDVMKYWRLKQRFERHIKEVYANCEDRMAF